MKTKVTKVSEDILRKLTEPTTAAAPLFPAYVRVANPYGACPITGMKREAMLNLILARPCNSFKPPVKSVLIKKPGAKRGCRYVSTESLLSYMASLEVQSA